jgi:hypothetical protein
MGFFPTPSQPRNPEIAPKYILFKTDDSTTRADFKSFNMNANNGGSVKVGQTITNRDTSIAGQFGLKWNQDPALSISTFESPWASNFAVIPWPSAAILTEQASTLTTQTQGGIVVERKANGGGFVSGDWTISGKIAPIPFLPFQYEAMAKEGIEYTLYPLPIAFQILHQAIRLTNEVAADPSARLIMYSIQEGEYWYVEPLTRARIRNSELRTGYTYEFNFRLLQRAKPPVFSYVYDAIITKQNWFDKLVAAIKKVIKLVKNAIALVEYVVKKIGQIINEVKLFLQDIADMWTEILGFVSSILDAPEALCQWGKAWSQQFVNAVDGLVSSWNGMVDFLEGLGSDDATDNASEGMNAAGLASAGLTLSEINEIQTSIDGVVETTSEIMVDIRTAMGEAIKNRVARPITPGETLEMIATSVYGNAGYAEQIAKWNNLRPPYISNTGIPGTMRPGDILYLPYALTGASGTMATFEPMTAEEQIFGRGIKLVTSGEWKGDYEVSADGQGVNEVIGNDCVAQGLRIRMGTPLGENRVFPKLGIPAAVGQISSTTSQSVFDIAVSWQLRADNRVDTIKELIIEDTGETIKIKPTVTLKQTAEQIQVA